MKARNFMIPPLLLVLLSVPSAWSVESQWITLPELADHLPATLTPFLSTKVSSKGECFMYCDMKISQCDSVAYSETYGLCKLFSHPNLAKPVPNLAPDPWRHHVYYRTTFCPAGWLKDRDSKTCYLASSSPLKRPEAWTVCDNSLMSSMVMFQTPQQRSFLYQALLANYSSITKWWTGYAMFDNRIFPRPVEEIPGYIKRRGDCPGNDLLLPKPILSVAECANKCDRVYRDKCVAFGYRRSTKECTLKSVSCDYGSTGDPLSSDYWTYDKIHKGRPYSTQAGVDCPNNDIGGCVSANTYDECVKHCRSNPQCLVGIFNAPTKGCCIKYKTCMPRTGSGGGYTLYEVKEADDGPCPYGARYHDTCLVKFRDSAQFYDAKNNCRRMGGIMIRPTELIQKMPLFANFQYQDSAMLWVDYVDEGHEGNWTTSTDSETLQAPIYDRWSWILKTDGSYQPDGGTGENCAMAWGPATASQPAGSYLLDQPCSTSGKTVCETPISQSWPTECRFTPPGREYMGTLSTTVSGVSCKSWSDTVFTTATRIFPEGHTAHKYCRNADISAFGNSVWCYRSDNDQAEACSVPMCPESDWAANQTFSNYNTPYVSLTYSAVASENYDWVVEDINAVANPLCSLPMDSWCPYYFQGSCYMYYSLWKDHSSASSICTGNGWHLVAITSLEEHRYVVRNSMTLAKLWTQPLRGYHLGLTGNSAIGYTWASGEPFSYTMWASSEPNGGSQQCTFLQTSSGDGSWYDDTCEKMAFFICEIDLTK